MITLDPSADETNFSETDFYEFGIYQPEGILLTKDNMLSVEVKGNLGYRVLISALSNSLIGPVGETLPMAQLRWRLHSEEDKTPRPWQPISTKSVLIIERTGAGLIEFSLDFQILATWDVAPAVYKGMILLTVIPQD